MGLFLIRSFNSGNTGLLRHIGNRFDLRGLPSHVVLMSNLFSREFNTTLGQWHVL